MTNTKSPSQEVMRAALSLKGNAHVRTALHEYIKWELKGLPELGFPYVDSAIDFLVDRGHAEEEVQFLIHYYHEYLRDWVVGYQPLQKRQGN